MQNVKINTRMMIKFPHFTQTQKSVCVFFDVFLLRFCCYMRMAGQIDNYVMALTLN